MRAYNEYKKQIILDLIKKYSIKMGPHLLSSGRVASYYLDSRLVTLSSEGAKPIGEVMKGLVLDHFPTLTAFGGPTTGADPIVGAVLSEFSHNPPTAERPVPIRGFLVRKEPKQHGTKSLIEGPLAIGDRAVVVEDVCTSGQSVLKAVQAVQAHGAEVLGVICLVDRLEGAAALLEGHGVPFLSVLTILDLGIEIAGA